IAITQHAMAALLQQQGRPQEAMALYEHSLLTKQELGDIREIAVTQGAMAALFQQQGRPQEAMALYEQALHTKQELGDIREIAVTEANFAQLLFQQGEQVRALSLAWHAFTSLASHGYTRDAQIMQEILASLKEQFADTAHFDALWEQAVYEPQPDWLRTVPPGEQRAGNASDSTDETIKAIGAFVNAKDWDATHQVVEAQKDILFKPETETALEALVAQAEAAHDERVEQLFEMHLDVLRACKSLGIAETFRQIASARQEQQSIDEEENKDGS
ncbi:MAG: tetratricopeptide repeat protein, partial [Ktedonobacteraceae bacterium]